MSKNIRVRDIDAEELMNYVQDFVDTFEIDELAQMVRERVLTIEEVEAGLRRVYDCE